eukprot:5055634-Amphidinium_carterae.1
MQVKAHALSRILRHTAVCAGTGHYTPTVDAITIVFASEQSSHTLRPTHTGRFKLRVAQVFRPKCLQRHV